MQAILFDFDGVIVRSMEDHFEGWRRTLAEYDIEVQPEEIYVLEGSGEEELANQFSRKFNLPYYEIPNIIERNRYHLDQISNEEIYHNLQDLLDWIDEKGMKTALVTGTKRERVIAILEKFKLMDKFMVIITADDVMFSKPAPEPYLLAAELLDVEASECVVIENAPLGVMSAKNAGMRCIALTTTLSKMHLKQADVIADDLDEALNSLKKMY
ncbi:MAG: HAD family phosphatase [Calditrichaeota bacterium]|nr:HAD family phosphatase [Calditrichota bacterium]MCB0266604.1 HAD family phosphatase [Calditrichota bacterium]MCB0285749.1 HAD family phosphatase [Calditrichota bacterium]MCB0300506.1 HAD family phosphatase [Calditrichota bacterium]MCB9068179.1 HAD family phosphatase [Calditrichia bacterium]